MEKLINHYLEYLATHPGKLDSIYLWTVSTMIIYIILFKYRERMISGMSGGNALFESPEVIGYLLCWLFPPIVNYSAFFERELPSWVWYFLSGGVAYTLGGRWMLEWILAFKTGASKVETGETTKEKKDDSVN